MQDLAHNVVALRDAWTTKQLEKESWSYFRDAEAMLKDAGITKESLILDVPGGSGFFALELARKGYRMNYNDFCPEIKTTFIRKYWNEETADLITPACQGLAEGGSWAGLETFPSETWDGLICRGNVLPYATSLGTETQDTNAGRERIAETLRHFHRVTKEGGMLYVDRLPVGQENTWTSRPVSDCCYVDGRKLHINSIISTDRSSRTCSWELIVSDPEKKAQPPIKGHDTRPVSDGPNETHYPSTGYLLLEDELMDMLSGAGYRDIKKRVLTGDIYEGFVARKLAGPRHYIAHW